MDSNRPASKEPRYEASVSPPDERVDRPEWVPQWTVRGVAPATRQAAIKAAQHVGMNLGRWIDMVLHEAAVKTQGQGSRRAWVPQWTVRGVAPETRQAVTRAAQREGMSQGCWVDKILREAMAETSDASLPGIHEKI